MGKTAAWMCLPFCSLIMKIMVLKGVRLPRGVMVLVHQCLISMLFLQMSKSHFSAEREKQNLSKTPKSEFVPHVTPSDHGLVAHITLGHIEIASPHIPEPQTTSTQPGQSSSHADRLNIFLRVCMSVFQDLLMSYTPPITRFKCVSQPLRHS